MKKIIARKSREKSKDSRRTLGGGTKYKKLGRMEVKRTTPRGKKKKRLGTHIIHLGNEEGEDQATKGGSRRMASTKIRCGFAQCDLGWG